MPEILWKAYIDFEVEQDETDRARDLYKRLLTRTQHVKVSSLSVCIPVPAALLQLCNKKIDKVSL